jgi:hypothetical protein
VRGWLVLLGVLAAVGLSGCQWDEARFFDLRVVNNTHRPVKIRPCWDVDCLQVNGMPITVLRPGGSRDEDSWWPNDVGQEVVVAVLSPTGKQIIGCLITTFVQGQRMGLVHTSQQRACLRGSEQGGGG